jgi:DNA-binding NtrC family response regulator
MREVLIVDDEAAMREALEVNFRRRGWRVKSAGGVEEAVQQFQREPSRLVITDKINLSTQENALVGIDPAVAATNFSRAQVADQATLSATAKILSLPTLLDFLK